MISELSNKILRVNPHKIMFYSEPPNWKWFHFLDKRIKIIFVKDYLKKIALGKMFYGGNWDIKSISFDKTHWYIQIQDLKENISKVECSIWYKLIMEEIQKKGHYFHKKIKIKDKKQAILFFENYVLNLVQSLNDKNFIIENIDDIPTALIGRNGELIKSGHGCHRLAIIKSFNIKCEFPIKIIGIHKEFNLKNANEIYDYVKTNYSLKKN